MGVISVRGAYGDDPDPIVLYFNFRAAHFKTESISIVYDRILWILNVSEMHFKITPSKKFKITERFQNKL